METPHVESRTSPPKIYPATSDDRHPRCDGLDRRLWGWQRWSSEAAGLDAAAATNRDLKLLWIACGKDDFLSKRNHEFNALLKDKGIRYEFVETEGGHSWPVWRRYLTNFVPLLFR